jgi:endogenous inhibitor of DNA gyrase (YacG/DUF329 family)
MIDLGHWFEESYKVPLKEEVKDEEDDIQVENEDNYED